MLVIVEVVYGLATDQDCNLPTQRSRYGTLGVLDKFCGYVEVPQLGFDRASDLDNNRTRSPAPGL
jgi:hypothetical protein